MKIVTLCPYNKTAETLITSQKYTNTGFPNVCLIALAHVVSMAGFIAPQLIQLFHFNLMS